MAVAVAAVVVVPGGGNKGTSSLEAYAAGVAVPGAAVMVDMLAGMASMVWTKEDSGVGKVEADDGMAPVAATLVVVGVADGRPVRRSAGVATSMAESGGWPCPGA